jgi:hypothetical protein
VVRRKTDAAGVWRTATSYCSFMVCLDTQMRVDPGKNRRAGSGGPPNHCKGDDASSWSAPSDGSVSCKANSPTHLDAVISTHVRRFSSRHGQISGSYHWFLLSLVSFWIAQDKYIESSHQHRLSLRRNGGYCDGWCRESARWTASVFQRIEHAGDVLNAPMIYVAVVPDVFQWT